MTIAAIDGRPYAQSGIVIVELLIVAFERLTRDFLPRQEGIATSAKTAQSKWHWAIIGAQLGERAEQTVEIESVGKGFLVTLPSHYSDGF